MSVLLSLITSLQLQLSLAFTSRAILVFSKISFYVSSTQMQIRIVPNTLCTLLPLCFYGALKEILGIYIYIYTISVHF